MKSVKSNHNKIDHKNVELWNQQYSNPHSIYITASLLLKESTNCKYEKGLAYANLNIAKASFLQSSNKEAFESLSACRPYFYEHTDEIGYSWFLCLQGNMYESIGDFERGLEFCHKSLKNAEKADDKVTVAEAANTLGLIYCRLSDFDEAKQYYNRALAVFEEQNNEDAAASSLNRMGMVSRQLKCFEESVSYYNRSLEIRQRKSLLGAIPWTYLGIASTYEEMGNFTEAARFYQNGTENNDKRCSMQCELGLGRILSMQGDSVQAEIYLVASLQKATELNALPFIADIYTALALHYERNKKYQEALFALRNFQSIKESVLSAEAQNRLRNAEVIHAVEKSEQEKEIYRLRHIELKKAYELIEQKNNEIMSSIHYARYIQQAILPDPNDFKKLVKKCFILYLPKDIISGDFYWFNEKNEQIIFAAADCTGHGVPGALMSMLGISLLNEIINERNISDAGKILDLLREEIIRSLNQMGNSKSKDGMDISLFVYDRRNHKMQWAGAYNSLYLIREGTLIEYKADRMPIGIHQKMDSNFTRNDFEVKKGDMIYICSDGYADQFGGANQKKFGYKLLTNLFVEVHKLPLKKQKNRFEKCFYSWKDKGDQIDDVLIIGFKV